jgi:uncharacterized protein
MPTETVLITGASSGIGLELARLFAAEGSALVLVARSGERLRELAAALERAHGTRTVVLEKDLSDPEAPRAIHEELRRAGIAVDVLVNNAGFGARGPFAELPLDRQLDMVQVNVAALVRLTGLFLPGMRERGRGGILNVASTAAFQAGPLMAVYYATKAFVLHFTEALAEESRDSGVVISCLAPGPTATGFMEAAGMRRTRLFRGGAMDARKVAEAGLRGFRAGRVIVVPGLLNRFAAGAVRFLPRSLARKAAGALQK